MPSRVTPPDPLDKLLANTSRPHVPQGLHAHIMERTQNIPQKRHHTALISQLADSLFGDAFQWKPAMAFMSVLACATFSIGMLQTSAIDAHTDEENPELMVLDEMDWFEEWTDVDAA